MRHRLHTPWTCCGCCCCLQLVCCHHQGQLHLLLNQRLLAQLLLSLQLLLQQQAHLRHVIAQMRLIPATWVSSASTGCSCALRLTQSKPGRT